MKYAQACSTVLHVVPVDVEEHTRAQPAETKEVSERQRGCWYILLPPCEVACKAQGRILQLSVTKATKSNLDIEGDWGRGLFQACTHV
jgi:hypothetical protein